METILLSNLKDQYLNIRDEVLSVIDEICLQSAFIKGPYVRNFEQAFIQANKASYGVGCSNGTAAISMALEVLGIGAGDEVILPSHTFVATAEAICHVGATPVFTDIKLDDYTIDPSHIKSKLTSRTKAIIPVHIYGTPCEMDEIKAIAELNNLKVIEDCAQAHFAQYKGQYVSTFGDAATFSFYPGKNLGAYGDAGFIICKDKHVEEKLKRLIDHGRLDKYDHEIVGYNQRLDAIQAAILSIKLKHIHTWNEKRLRIAEAYDQAFKPAGFKVIETDNNKKPVYHVYNIEVSNREEVQRKLKDQGIQTGIHYPMPLHKMDLFQKNYHDKLAVSEAISGKIMSLPIYPEMTKENLELIISSFLSYAK